MLFWQKGNNPFFFPGGSITVQIGEILPLPDISPLLEEKPGSHSLATWKMRVLVLDFKAITGCICLHDTRKQYCKIGYRMYIQKKCPWQWASTFNPVFTIYRRSVVCINWLLRIHNLVQQWWRVKGGGGNRACCERYGEMKQFSFCLCLCHWALNKLLSSERGFLRWKSFPVFPPSVILYKSKILPWF